VKTPRERVFVTDDDRAFRVATLTLLEDEGYEVGVAASGREALTELGRGEFDLVLSDMVMGEMSGIELLREIKKRWPGLPVIMVTGFGSIPTAVEAMRLGAADYLTKPANNEELLMKVRRALDIQRMDRELQSLREELRGTYSYGSIVSRSEKMRDILRQIRQVVDTDVTVLIEGESGTGKELVARSLHYNSKRRDAPFVALNCSAVPENLLESELFGYEKGAFTGAVRTRAGRFEEAHTGTLFLDEIGDLAPGVQTKLLRVIQEKSFERVGGNTQIKVDTRLVAATNRNLELMVAQGDFRDDLYYRLNVFPVRLPPLRERLEDLPLLAEHFLQRHADLAGGRVKGFAPTVLTSMMNYTWRGNIRELENLVKRAIIKCPGDTITSVELPTPQAELSTVPGPSLEIDLHTPYKDYLSAIVRHTEQDYLVRMLRLCKGNINQVAKQMGVDRKTIYRKLSEYSIDPASYRS
jgi:two-component system, NtrC family, response regulator